jgi:two-component system, LytTR family, response regulator
MAKIGTQSSTALCLPFQAGQRWVDFGNIVRLEGIGNYTNCVFADGSQLLVALTLKRLQARIPAGLFLRSHRKHLINRTHVTTVHRPTSAVLLANGERLAISRRRLDDVRRMMNS